MQVSVAAVVTRRDGLRAETVTHPDSNRAQRTATSLIETNMRKRVT